MAKVKQIDSIESATPGFANGVSTQLFRSGESLQPHQRQAIIEEAAKHFSHFLTALGVDWAADPNSDNTPMRVAKAYVNDLWSGRYKLLEPITTFPSDGYDGLIQESGIPVMSMCSHHHQTIKGVASVGYIASKDGQVVGLSKLNRIVEHFSRRGAIQEQMTVAIHNAVDKICAGNKGVAVAINATHNCVSCRGIKHDGASTQTAKLSGQFKSCASTRNEFYDNIKLRL
jgi:GTP cyclohydrolase IA